MEVGIPLFEVEWVKGDEYPLYSLLYFILFYFFRQQLMLL